MRAHPQVPAHDASIVEFADSAGYAPVRKHERVDTGWIVKDRRAFRI